MDSFLKILGFNANSKFYMGMSLCAPLKFGICDIYNLFCAILMQHFTQNLFIFYVNSIRWYHLITAEAII